MYIVKELSQSNNLNRYVRSQNIIYIIQEYLTKHPATYIYIKSGFSLVNSSQSELDISYKASWSFFLYSDFELDDARFSCIQLLVVRNVNCLLEIELMGMLAAMEFDEIIAKHAQL